MQLLDCPVRNYAWGSRTALAGLRGEPGPSPHPEAELWMGAHPADPSRLVGSGATLLVEIAEDPVAALGQHVCERFDKQLPFLMKVLAAEEPLSIQAHPSKAQAQEGFERENQRGVPLDASSRNYKDDNHKPELLVALTQFSAMAGFRDPEATVALLEELGSPRFVPYRDLLAEQPDGSGLRALFTTWITLPSSDVAELVDDLAESCVALLGRSPRGPFAEVARNLLQLVERYPGDAGVLASILLNHITLQPGEGIFLDAGNLHAYLHGVGVELMANSDNVLRGGLTPKHVDVPELLRVVDFEPLELSPVPVRNAEPGGTAEQVYQVPIDEFALSRIELDATGLLHSVSHGLSRGGPQIIACTRGEVIARSGGEEVRVPAGGALWIPDSDPEVILHAGTARDEVFRAVVPQ
ncbi:mannose-6-phosphate isomerase, class I [Lolliginicoccus suaedae]|uniref:mannose-6-phosphate isomerase, class I n=1 Tax=Lolliginicoccus suaedae TaxID=2605429 RepID=UPI0011ECF9D2|nr:mannose-6-phosphate isomerase, class I [Lolliginicoccus suaedae]